MSGDKKVVDFNQKRRESIEQKRRTFERVVFQEFLGVYTVLDDKGSSFPVTLKLFFTKGSYLPAVVTIRHTSVYVDKDGQEWLRLGGEFDTSLPSFTALSHFISFIYEYAEFSCLDRGESKVFFL
jgi:hypothetical protein